MIDVEQDFGVLKWRPRRGRRYEKKRGANWKRGFGLWK
jgi:hypothetical protein